MPLEITQIGDRMVGMDAISIRRFAHVSDINQALTYQSQNERVVRLARLAMLIECEGSITIGMMPPSKTRNRPALSVMVGITNTAKHIIDEARETLIDEGIGFSVHSERHGGGRGKKLRQDISIHAFDRTELLLKTIMPYLRSKKRQAELVMEFIQSRRSAAAKAPYTDYEWALTTAIRKLNGTQPQAKALAKAKAYLELHPDDGRSRTTLYFRKYVEMCTTLQEALAAL